MEIKYFIGIGVGVDETTACRVPGYKGQFGSLLPLEPWSCAKESPVIYSLFSGDEKKQLGEFVKLVLETILNYDHELKYNPLTGDANFEICIVFPTACSIPHHECLSFFKDECGIKPITMCINESDAAFYYTQFNKGFDDSVFVIDLGSSTIDFTIYDSSECKEEACWGDCMGAHRIVDLLINKAYEDETNVTNMRKVSEERKRLGLSSADAAISRAICKALDEFFTNHLDEFELDVRSWYLIPGYESKREVAFSLYLNEEAFRQVIKSYQEELELVFANAAKKLSNLGIHPTEVLLLRHASLMDFVSDAAKKAFPNSSVYRAPRHTYSAGGAIYLWLHYQQKLRLFESII